MPGADYRLLFIAKGGGSANKTFLFQQTTALLRPEKLRAFLTEKIATLGAAACPPYHLALVIGGLSAEQTLKTVKLASTRSLASAPETKAILPSISAMPRPSWPRRVICSSTGSDGSFCRRRRKDLLIGLT